MNTTLSPSERPDDKTANELETLFEQIDQIDNMLEPLNDAGSTVLRSQVEEERKKLESLDNNNLSSVRLSILRKEISRLKAKAESMVNNSFIVTTSFLRNETEEIEKLLELAKDAEADVLRSEKEDVKKKLESINTSDLLSLQGTIRNLKEKAEILAARSFLLAEIGGIEKMLVSIKSNPAKRAELNSLELDKESKKKRLVSADEYELASLRKEISKIKERAESLVAKESWHVRLGKVSVLVWLGIIPLLLAVYVASLALFQWRNPDRLKDYGATQTAIATLTMVPTGTQTVTPVPTP